MSPLTIMLLFITASCAAAPTDPTPVQVDLPVYDEPQKRDPEIAVPLEQAGVVDERSDYMLSMISSKLHMARGILSGKFADHRPTRAGYASKHRQEDLLAYHRGIPDYSAFGIFSPPVTSLEGAIMETEDFGSKSLSVKDNIHHLVAGIFHPKPLLDTISPDDKNGNREEHAAGRAIVAGVENVSNILNSLLEAPGTIIKKITRAATEKLNNLGGRLIGL